MLNSIWKFLHLTKKHFRRRRRGSTKWVEGKFCANWENLICIRVCGNSQTNMITHITYNNIPISIWIYESGPLITIYNTSVIHKTCTILSIPNNMRWSKEVFLNFQMLFFFLSIQKFRLLLFSSLFDFGFRVWKTCASCNAFSI